MFSTACGGIQKQLCSLHGQIQDQRKKVGFVAVILNSTNIGPLPRKASIHTAEMLAIKTALRKIYNREDRYWVLYN